MNRYIGMNTYVGRRSQCTIPYTGRRGKMPRRRWSQHTVSYQCTTCTQNPHSCTRYRRNAERRGSGIASQCGQLQRKILNLIHISAKKSISFSSTALSFVSVTGALVLIGNIEHNTTKILDFNSSEGISEPLPHLSHQTQPDHVCLKPGCQTGSIKVWCGYWSFFQPTQEVT